jgi:class 3 adenylate cyclase
MSGEPEGSQRRLAAILSMDAVGYSRLMAADEAATVRTLTACRDEIARLVAGAGGRVVDSPGDNVLCEFPAATSAVACALEVQRVLGELNAPLPSERRLVFRIGVHLGEVLAQGPRIYGDGVNIAARLEGLAEPGGVCVSQAVRVHRVRSAESGGALHAPPLGTVAVAPRPSPIVAAKRRITVSLDEPPHDGAGRAGCCGFGRGRDRAVAVCRFEGRSGHHAGDGCAAVHQPHGQTRRCRVRRWPT